MTDDYPLFAPLVLDRPESYEEPWFEPRLLSLATKSTQPLVHTDTAGRSIATVTAGSPLGIATTNDFNVIIRMTSVLMMQKKEGLLEPPKTIGFHPYAWIPMPAAWAESKPPKKNLIDKDPDNDKDKNNKTKAQYTKQEEALRRLRDTKITVATCKGKEESFFWLQDFSAVRNAAENANSAWTATISDFLWHRIVVDEAVVPLNPGHLQLSGGWNQWMHIVARQVADDKPACFPETLIKAKVNYKGKPDRLRSYINKVKVPGYTVESRHKKNGDPYTVHIDPV